MGKDRKRLLLVMMFCVWMIASLPITAAANSAEPPSLVILVNHPPDDLSIVLVSGESQPEAKVRRVAWEGYYAFYSRDLQADGGYTFRATTKDGSFEFAIGELLQHYNNVYTLDVANQELRPGKYPLRSALLVSIRLLLTLLLEAGIFWLFRFRQKRSWLIFLAINVVTQGILNIWLNSGGSLMPNYLIVSLIFGEVFVFAAEMMAFPIFIKEHQRSRSLIYAFVANLISLIAGGYIISVLPV